MPKVNINGNELYILNSQRKGAAIAVKAVISRKGFYEELGNISIPSLIIIGDQDKLVEPEQSLKMQKRIAASELVTIPNAGHMTPVESPEVVNLAILNFLMKHR